MSWLWTDVSDSTHAGQFQAGQTCEDAKWGRSHLYRPRHIPLGQIARVFPGKLVVPRLQRFADEQ